MADPTARPPIDTEPLTGRQVRLRELREEDILVLAEWWNEPAVARWLHRNPQPRSPESVAEVIRGWGQNVGSDCRLAVVKREDGELVGQASLFGATPKDRCATFAIAIGPDHQNLGYGTEATRLLIRYGFTELGLHRIELNVYSFNVRAMAAYAKAGFVEEGRRRESMWRSGRWHDTVTMGILCHEWREDPGASS